MTKLIASSRRHYTNIWPSSEENAPRPSNRYIESSRAQGHAGINGLERVAAHNALAYTKLAIAGE